MGDLVNTIGGALGAIDPVTKLFNGVVGIGKKPQTPTFAPPAVMPMADDAAVQAARRRQAAALQQRSGRMSTILSTDDKLGGP